ncbi:hypothetical protein D3C84_671950 [compost metagenome]
MLLAHVQDPNIDQLAIWQRQVKYISRLARVDVNFNNVVALNNNNGIPVFRQRVLEPSFMEGWRSAACTCTVNEKFHIVQELNIFCRQTGLRGRLTADRACLANSIKAVSHPNIFRHCRFRHERFLSRRLRRQGANESLINIDKPLTARIDDSDLLQYRQFIRRPQKRFMRFRMHFPHQLVRTADAAGNLNGMFRCFTRNG